MAIKLTLPQAQNWSCHNCGGCCKQHGIVITEAERDRIASQGWTEADGVPNDWYVEEKPLMEKRWLRMNHRDDGSCIFLDDKGLCKIHGKFGELAKPLACRIYPYVFHPAGNRMTVSLRFSCPSVVRNLGKPVERNRGELNSIAKLVVPEAAMRIDPPAISAAESCDWDDFRRLINALDETITDTSKPLVDRLRIATLWVSLVGQAKLTDIGGARLGELVQLLVSGATAEVEQGDPPSPPQSIGMVQFRLLVGHYARADTHADRRGGWRNRVRLFKAAWGFASGKGMATPFLNDFRPVPFEQLERGDVSLPEEFDELITRYLSVKVRGLHFCGRAYYDIPFAEGFQSLALIVPVIAVLSRWVALSSGRETIDVEDVVRGIAVADHHHGFSPALGRAAFRRRVRLLVQSGDVSALLAHYVRVAAKD